jgi:hypothetical protein
MAAAFDDVRLARIVSSLPLNLTALALVALLAGLVLRIPAVIAVTVTAMAERGADALTARTEVLALTVVLAVIVAVLRLASLALVYLIRGADAVTAAVLAEAKEVTR